MIDREELRALLESTDSGSQYAMTVSDSASGLERLVWKQHTQDDQANLFLPIPSVEPGNVKLQ